MFNDNPIIIFAAGNSIPFSNVEGIDPKLKNVIDKNITIGINYFNFYGCETTISCFGDPHFYLDNKDWLEKLPFIVGKYDPKIQSRGVVLPNSILLPPSRSYFGRDSWKVFHERCMYCKKDYLAKLRLKRCGECGAPALMAIGFYHSHLTSLFSLTLAIALGFKKIYLMGYDAKEIDGKTHFYQDLVDLKEFSKTSPGLKKFYGVGKEENGDYRIQTFSSEEKVNNWYAPYVDEADVEILNVSETSAIHHFKKISYNEFYQQIKGDIDNQDQIRKEIRLFIENILPK